MCDLQRKRFLPQHFQRFRFWLQCSWCIAWPCVTLALQNMPPKARTPEARMAFEWGQVSGVKFCTCSGPSRCLSTVALISSSCSFHLHLLSYSFSPHLAKTRPAWCSLKRRKTSFRLFILYIYIYVYISRGSPGSRGGR